MRVDSYYDKVTSTSGSLRTVLSIVTLGTLLLVLGCGSQNREPEFPESAEGDNGPAPVVVPAGDDPRPVLVAFGDSLTSGHRVTRENTYPAFLQQELDRRGLAFRVINEGISGDTTAKALSRVGTALSHDPQWVILALGANDGLRGLPLDEMERNLREMVRQFREGGAQVLLAGMMLPRNYGPDYVQEFETVYPRVAEDLGLPSIRFLLEGVAMVRELNNSDGIHPNREGNRIVARHVANAFEAALAN